MSENLFLSPPVLNGSHWGAFEPVVSEGCVTETRPFAKDPDPSPLLRSIPDALHHASRVAQPAVRAGWLEDRPGGARDRRGTDRSVPVSWERALDLIADEIRRVISERGNQAIFAGSYGWGSAGRFHHARTQLQRFLGGIGGYTGARDTYSNAAGGVLVKNVLGSMHAINGPGTSWKSIADHPDLVVMFGGVPTRNTQVTPGGMGEHTTHGWLEKAKAAGVEFCNISPMRDDAAAFLDAEWIAPRPHSDTALMLGLAHTLIVEGLHDADFLACYCAGFNRFREFCGPFDLISSFATITARSSSYLLSPAAFLSSSQIQFSSNKIQPLLSKCELIFARSVSFAMWPQARQSSIFGCGRQRPASTSCCVRRASTFSRRRPSLKSQRRSSFGSGRSKCLNVTPADSIQDLHPQIRRRFSLGR